MTQPRPLTGITVVDLTHVLAGPYCTYQLSLLGADVIKIESPRGDMVRGWGGDQEQVSKKLGTGFVAQNAGKKSVVIDLHAPDGPAVVRELAARADVFVENYRPGALAARGLGAEDLMAENPQLIYLSISAFGHNGPNGHRPGFDDVVQATSGFMSINVRGDGPIRTGGPVLDYATGMHATSSVLAALMLREQTGEGQRIDVAMQDVTMLLMNRNTSIAATAGEALPPPGNRDAPLLGRYQTADGYVMLAGYLPAHQRSILAAVGLHEEAALPTRVMLAQMPAIEAKVEAVLLTRGSAEWDAHFSAEGIVAGGVAGLMDVLESGQPEARQLLSEVSSSYGEHQVTNAGYRVNETTFTPRGPVPDLGQHTREVLRDLGWTQDAIDAAIASGAVGSE